MLIIKSSKILINSGRSREMMQKVQRFGSAMFVPVLLFAFSGIIVGLSTL
ncbi:hypothetical protein ACQKF6_14155, partial [Bacillus velezensis]